VWWGWSFRAW
ncbi:hypothetical protein EE612_025342, partial [Oryza sativa]